MIRILLMAVPVFILSLLNPVLSCSHEVRPGYLDISESKKEAGHYSMIWKAPGRVGMVMKINPVLPEECRDIAPPEKQKLPGSLVERRVVDCGTEGLKGKTITIEGLTSTITDVLVQIKYRDGQSQTELLKPHAPSVVIKGAQPWYNIAGSYVRYGIKHILYGIDHLLFVLGLLLLSWGWVQLLKTITAFTVGHSISLALATFGMVTVPGKPLGAAIALSIVFLAGELVQARRGNTSLTIRYPWAVSFGFGILHGLGFASALTELGLPDSAIPLALFFFNVGVEIGQLIFVGVSLILIMSLIRMGIKLEGRWKILPVYGMGSIAGFWFVQRFVLMFI